MLQNSLHKQNGAVLVQFGLLAAAIFIILGVVQIGYMYSAKRDLQRIADLASIEAVNAYNLSAAICTNANAAGVKSINAQWPIGVTPQGALSSMIVCGNWTKESGFSESQINGIYNAAKVTLTGESLQILPFTGNRIIAAQAVAAIASDPEASFSVGSGVARLNAGALNSLLSMLLGTNVNLSLVDYQGLANTKIDLLGLTEAIGLSVGTYDDLVNTDVSLSQLLNAAIAVASRDPDNSTADIAITAIGQLLNLPVALNLTDTYIHLLKTASQAGLLDIGLYQESEDSPPTALNADVSALNILMVALQIANKDSALSLNNTGLNLSPLANIELSAKIIEPPSIASGQAGQLPDGRYKTTAHTGQVRVAMKLKALNSVGANNTLLDLNLLLIRLTVSLPAGQLLELPLYVEVGSADARLEAISCYAKPGVHNVQIGAKPGVAYALLGNAPDAMTNLTAPWTDLAKEKFNLLNLRVKASLLLGIVPLLDAPVALKAKLDLQLEDEKNYESLNFEYASDVPYSEQSLIQSVGSEKKLGASIANAINGNLLDLELDTSGLSLLGVDIKYISEIIDGLVNNLGKLISTLLPLVSGILTPILNGLDNIIGPLLQALGLQISYADVQLLSADCSPAQIVQ
ncbi:MAG: pilus assembly protein TadG-related protein [Ottowia sp.]|uniref:pilus assembly protein TadG-related protein n=1 Tax=Ottowia sp. TaxID=1898956 RepID=UPI003C75829E